MIGQKLGNRYEIIRTLGEGSMGVVYKARDPLLERDVAIKLVKPNVLTPEAQERFRREALVVARFDHTSLVAVYDTGEHDGSLFFVMPYVEGESLRALLDRGGLALDDLLNIVTQVAEALEYSHSRGVIHRDIKPENILVMREPQGFRARVTDFGLALGSQDQRLTGSGVVVGTVAYLSPEIVSGMDADSRSDIYSLGVVLYEGITGRTPFIGDLRSILYGVVYDEPLSPRFLGAEITEDLNEFLMKCLERDRDERPQRAQEMADELSRLRLALLEHAAPSLSSSVIRPLTGRTRQISFIGRAKEYSELQRALEEASNGQCRFVMISGDAGIGKSYLVEQFITLAGARQIPVYQGRYSEGDRGFPHQAFCEVFQEYFRSRSSTTSADRNADFADLAARLTSLFPVLADTGFFPYSSMAANEPQDLPEPESESENSKLYDLLARSLIRISGGQTLVIVLEDLHHAGESVVALHPVLMRLSRAPIVIVGAFRPSETGRSHPLMRMVRNLINQKNFTLLELKPLPLSEFRKLVENLTSNSSPGEAFIEKLFEATEGNPYFTREVIRSLVDSGALTRNEQGKLEVTGDLEMTFDSLPATVQQTVESRMRRLPDSVKDVLSTASILGRTFEAQDLEFLLERRGDVEDAIDQLLLDGFLEERKETHRSDRLRFSSPMVCDASYAMLSRRKRKAYHGSYAEELERRNAAFLERVYPQLIHHYARAGIAPKVVEYGLAFAKNSLRAFGVEEAIRSLKVVLEYEPGMQEGAARRLLGEAFRIAGEADHSLEEFQKAATFFERVGESTQEVETMAAAADTAWQFRKTDDARRWIERGIPLAREQRLIPALRKFLSLAATACNLRGEYETAANYVQELDQLQKTSSVSAVKAGGGTLHVPLARIVEGLDPSRVFSLEEEETVPLIFETLTRQTKAAGIRPWLAAEYQAENGARAFRFRLRDNVWFHNGKKLTAKDVQYSLQRLIDRTFSRKRHLLSGMSEFQILNEMEFRIHLEQPISFFPALLADTSCAILPEGTSRVIGNWKEECHGTGPFRVARFEPAQILELEPHPNYWRSGFPKCDRLVFTFGVPPEEIASGFRSGLFSLAWDLHPEDVESLLRDSRLSAQFKETPSLSTYYLAFNVHHGVFTDEHLRHAVVAAVNREVLVRHHAGRPGIPAYSIIPPGLLGYDPEAGKTSDSGRSFDSISTEAVRMFDHEIQISGDIHQIYQSTYSEFKQALFECIRRKGFVIQEVEGKKRADHSPDSDADIELGRWSADYPDPDAVLYLLLQTSKGLLGRFSGSPEIDSLIEKGRSEVHPLVRHQLYREIEQWISEHAVMLPLFHEQAYRFAHREIQGFDVSFARPLVPYEKLWRDSSLAFGSSRK